MSPHRFSTPAVTPLGASHVQHINPASRFPGVPCACPDDCNCRSPWRTNFCGCLQHPDHLPLMSPVDHYVGGTTE